MPVASIRPGTIRNPPPMPKNPDRQPVSRPMVTSFGRFSRSSWTPARPFTDRRLSMTPLMTIMTPANNARSLWPSTIVPTVEPISAPTTPAAANTRAHRHCTTPERACCARFAAALTATATALVPIATWGMGTPPHRPAAEPREPNRRRRRSRARTRRRSRRRGQGRFEARFARMGPTWRRNATLLAGC